jgi:hypothetical protein
MDQRLIVATKWPYTRFGPGATIQAGDPDVHIGGVCGGGRCETGLPT